MGTGMVKISILLFCRRISPVNAASTTCRRIIWIAIVLTLATMVTFLFVQVFSCSPIQAYWEQLAPADFLGEQSYSCVSEPASLLAASAVSLLLDFVAAALPAHLFWNLTIPLRQKLALFAVFSLGFAVVVFGAVRIYYLYVIFYQSYDVTCKSASSLVSVAASLIMLQGRRTNT